MSPQHRQPADLAEAQAAADAGVLEFQFGPAWATVTHLVADAFREDPSWYRLPADFAGGES